MLVKMQIVWIIVILLNTQVCWSRPDGCGPGEVRDLDGSCVKKVTFPPREKKPCPSPVIERGEFFFDGQRIAYFYCDQGYTRVPDTERAVCQVTGSWSKQVPVCLQKGCKVPEELEHGHIIDDYDSMLLQFSCKHGYHLEGNRFLACDDGVNWNGTMPWCKLIPKPTEKSLLNGAGQTSYLESTKLTGIIAVVWTLIR